MISSEDSCLTGLTQTSSYDLFCPLYRDPSILLSSCTYGSQGHQSMAGTPRLPSPLASLPGRLQSIPRTAKWHIHSSMSWVFLPVSSWWDTLATPPTGGAQGASGTDTWANLADSLQWGGAVALHWAQEKEEKIGTYIKCIHQHTNILRGRVGNSICEKQIWNPVAPEPDLPLAPGCA